MQRLARTDSRSRITLAHALKPNQTYLVTTNPQGITILRPVTIKESLDIAGNPTLEVTTVDTP